jgi:hypothetical protein
MDDGDILGRDQLVRILTGTGHMIMMEPDKSYNFPGTKVFEIPHTAQWQTIIMQIQNQLKNGGWSAK